MQAPYARVLFIDFFFKLKKNNVSELFYRGGLDSTHTHLFFFCFAFFFSTAALGVSLLTFLSVSERSARVGDPVASDRGEQFVVRSVCFITVVQHPSNSRATFPGRPN